MNHKLIYTLLEHLFDKGKTLLSATISIQDSLVVKYIDDGGNRFSREFYIKNDTLVFRELEV